MKLKIFYDFIAILDEHNGPTCYDIELAVEDNERECLPSLGTAWRE